MAQRAAIVALAACAAACAASQRQVPPPLPRDRCLPAPVLAAGGERATLWVRQSAEFRAAAEATYRAAEAALVQALADPGWSADPRQAADVAALPPAVVMDVDETVLDNSEPQVRMLLEGTCLAEFAGTWDAWVAERRAPAVPGAIDFVRAARQMSDAWGRPVRVFFITNRECRPRAGNPSGCPQEEDIVANLRALGLDASTLTEDLMLKGEQPGWDADKLSRRLAVARTHRIVLNVGDDLGDFLPDVRGQSVIERDRARCANRERWGRQWFMIPNPMYGSWLVALGPDLEAALRSAAPAANCDGP